MNGVTAVTFMAGSSTWGARTWPPNPPNARAAPASPGRPSITDTRTAPAKPARSSILRQAPRAPRLRAALADVEGRPRAREDASGRHEGGRVERRAVVAGLG